MLKVWLLLFSATLSAHELRVDLSGAWRIETTQDRSEFARPDFDDHAWDLYRLPRPVTTPGLGAGVPPGTYWLRKSVTLPAEPHPDTLALTLGEVHEIYEVFVDGRSVGRTYIPGDPWSVHTARPRTFRFPHPGTDRLIIALRATMDNKLSGNRLGGMPFSLTQHPDAGPYLLTSAEGAPVDAEGAGRLKRLSAVSPTLAEAVTSALLGFLILLLYLSARESGELRILALLLAALAALRACQFGVILLDWPKAAIFPGPTLSAVTSGLLAWFLLTVSRLEKPWVNRLISTLAIFSVGARLGSLLLPPIFADASDLALAAVSLGTALVGIAGLRRAVAAEGWMGSRTWLNLIGLLLVLVDYQRTPSLRVFPPYWSALGLVGDVFDIAVIALSVAATWVIIRRLGVDRRERLRLASELEAARIVQQLMLPRTAFAGVEAVYLPAAEVGGDFWQCYACRDGARLLVVGDVSGKGLKAAMIVSLVTGVLQNRQSDEPALVLAELNRALAGKLDGGFVTAAAALVTPDGRMRWANAGHPSPYADGTELAGAPGLPLGIMIDADYTESDSVAAGQFTFVSDGVIEAANLQSDLFGFDRTRAMSTRPAQEIAEAAKQWGQNDDITVVTIETRRQLVQPIFRTESNAYGDSFGEETSRLIN